jgi:tRNA A-37 threonylcarbamoyl transferase component Bud32
MADVYRAHDTKLQRDVAIKVVRDAQFLGKERLKQMYDEARTLATLNHPNIASIHGIEESDGVCGLVLELIEGETLLERIRRAPLPIDELLEIAKQILTGLHAAHLKRIIHRDLKPANIKLTPDGTIKIIDFGIAKLMQAPVASGVWTDTIPGVVKGTIAYMSPEQARGKTIDERTDIWAFGCVLYEMLAGKPAFQGESQTDVIIKIVTENPDWNAMPSHDPVAGKLERIIRKCLEKDKDHRFRSVREITSAIASGQSEIEPLPPDPDPVPPLPAARAMFLLTQVGYLALYGAAMYHIEGIERILATDFQISGPIGPWGTMVLAMCGIAVRVYLISAVGWRHPAAGRKFTLLFPVLLILDGIWATSPLLLWQKFGKGIAGLGIAGFCVALLAYVPFAQRTLIRAIYPHRAVRIQTSH